LLDIGCGSRFTLLKALSPFIITGIGIDSEVEELEYKNILTYPFSLQKSLPFEPFCFDIVTMLAVLEHLSYPVEILKEIKRVMRPGGVLLITTPSPRARPVLEFLSYRLHLVSEKEIRDHKKYYDRQALQELLAAAGLSLEKHQYFQMGFNNFVVAGT
jgi:SAM-dependent methyltransferase